MRYPIAAAGALAAVTLILVGGVVAAIGTLASAGDAHEAALVYRLDSAIGRGAGYDAFGLGALDPRPATTDLHTLLLEGRPGVAGR